MLEDKAAACAQICPNMPNCSGTKTHALLWGQEQNNHSHLPRLAIVVYDGPFRLSSPFIDLAHRHWAPPALWRGWGGQHSHGMFVMKSDLSHKHTHEPGVIILFYVMAPNPSSLIQSETHPLLDGSSKSSWHAASIYSLGLSFVGLWAQALNNMEKWQNKEPRLLLFWFPCLSYEVLEQ